MRAAKQGWQGRSSGAGAAPGPSERLSRWQARPRASAGRTEHATTVHALRSAALRVRSPRTAPARDGAEWAASRTRWAVLRRHLHRHPHRRRRPPRRRPPRRSPRPARRRISRPARHRPGPARHRPRPKPALPSPGPPPSKPSPPPPSPTARRTTPPSPSPPPPHRLRHRLLPCCPRHPHRAQGLRPAEPEHSSAVAPSPSPPTPLHQRRRPADLEPDATISLLLSIQAGQQREWCQQASIEPLRAHSARRGGSRHPHTSLITPHTSTSRHRRLRLLGPLHLLCHLHHRHREAITAAAVAAISAAPNAAARASP